MLITPVANQSYNVNLPTPPRTGKAAGAAPKTSSAARAETPAGGESGESAAQETRETPALQAGEALKVLASQESAQLLETSPRTIFNSQAAARAYQQAKSA